MKIEYVTGNLLTSNELVIVHGCNAQGNMGAGIAKAIRDLYPPAYEAYRNHYAKHLGEDIMGQIIWAVCGPDAKPVLVGNAITQKFKGPRGQGVRYVSYDALDDVFRQLNDFAKDGEVERIGMPLIGADRGGGSWRVISSIIEATSSNYQPVVYLLDGKVPKT